MPAVPHLAKEQEGSMLRDIVNLIQSHPFVQVRACASCTYFKHPSWALAGCCCQHHVVLESQSVVQAHLKGSLRRCLDPRSLPWFRW